MRNARLNEAQAGIKIVRRNINNLRYADDTTLKAENEEELKSLLMKVKENTNRWGNSGNNDRIHFGGSKITADGDCSHEIKRCLLLGRKLMTKLDSLLKSRGITLPTKFHLVRAMVFPAVMYGCESWIIKKAEC